MNNSNCCQDFKYKNAIFISIYIHKITASSLLEDVAKSRPKNMDVLLEIVDWYRKVINMTQDKQVSMSPKQRHIIFTMTTLSEILKTTKCFIAQIIFLYLYDLY